MCFPYDGFHVELIGVNSAHHVVTYLINVWCAGSCAVCLLWNWKSSSHLQLSDLREPPAAGNTHAHTRTLHITCTLCFNGCVCVLLQVVCVRDSAPSVPSADSRMLSCSRCKRINHADARYCDWCGSKVKTHLKAPELTVITP